MHANSHDSDGLTDEEQRFLTEMIDAKLAAHNLATTYRLYRREFGVDDSARIETLLAFARQSAIVLDQLVDALSIALEYSQGNDIIERP